MSQNNTNARKLYWQNMDPAERKRRMRAIALAKHSKTSFAERRAHALKMVEARRKKQSKKSESVV